VSATSSGTSWRDAPGSTRVARWAARRRDRSEPSGAPEPFRQDPFEFVEEIGAGVDAPGRPFGGGEEFLGGRAEQGFRHVNVGVEEDLHGP
jgi:hypothetical protein